MPYLLCVEFYQKCKNSTDLISVKCRFYKTPCFFFPSQQENAKNFLFSLFANYSYSEINSVTVRYSELDGDATDGTNTIDIDANKLSLAHYSALSDDLALVLEYSMEESDHTTDQDTFAVELLYAF